jgi:hypothetical protein
MDNKNTRKLRRAEMRSEDGRAAKPGQYKTEGLISVHYMESLGAQINTELLNQINMIREFLCAAFLQPNVQKSVHRLGGICGHKISVLINWLPNQVNQLAANWEISVRALLGQWLRV